MTAVENMTVIEDRSRAAAWLLLSAFIVLVDQLSKTYITRHFGEFEFRSVLPILDITRMHNVGGVCDTLATIGDALLAQGHLRVFPQANFSAGGWAPIGGGTSGPNSWLLVSEDAADRLYDQAHAGYSRDLGSGWVYNTDLSSSLAHELDHLHGNDHITNPNNTKNGVLTPNTRACADLWMGN